MSKRVYTELPIVKEVELLKEAGPSDFVSISPDLQMLINGIH